MLLFLSFSWLASAQLSLFTIPAPGSESPVEGLLDVGAAPVGDLLDTRLRIRNVGTVSVNLTTLRVQGVAFSLIGNPTLPYLIAPGTNVDFRVRFLPLNTGSFSATLQTNDRSFFLRGIAIPAPRLYFDRDGKLEPITTDQTVDFGRVQRGESLQRRLLLRNEGPTAFTVREIRLSGPGLVLTLGFSLPAALAPGESAPFSIVATPPRSGILSGVLEVDGRQFKIDVTALDPPLPALTIQLQPEPLQSGRQAKVSVQLAAPSPLTTSVSLHLLFTPLNGSIEDPAIQFVSSASRSVNLSITLGDSVAKIGAQSDIVFQTGTTAGTLTLRLNAGFQSQEITATVGAAPVWIDTVRATRTTTGVEIACAGFDNS
ncbi:MAG: choice-of-anchor D domain-containing protein, partial [Bryobacterales bacterium]|nr:choice-of-anchor D domain-containing protein [Bryobacterales bacterium]